MNERGRFSPLFILAILLIILLIPGGCVAVRMLDRTAPETKVKPGVKAIGRATRLTIEAEEPKYGLTDLRATLVQGSLSVPLGEWHHPGDPWWRLFGRHINPSALLEVEVGRGRIPELKEGPATIRVEATNNSWAHWGRGRTSVAESVIPVVTTPPRVEVLSGQHYINHGGSECVVYRVSESATESGVRAGKYFFRGYPLPAGAPGAGPGTRFAIFAFPYDLPSTTVPVVVARDAADNEAKASFTYKLFPKIFPHATLHIDDAFMGRVVPPIQASANLTSQGDLLKDFLEINGHLRSLDAAKLVDLAGKSRPELEWKGAFVQLGNSKVEASFADHRSYEYRGRIVDQQDHLGFDLAVTANHPVDAANDGVVMLAEFFGIYGNTVILDHGCGLMTLYAHLSSIDVKPGDSVKRGQVIGRSGATGLAGGDHLHFSVLLQGIPVNPVEWWDPHWIHDRIESKIGARG